MYCFHSFVFVCFPKVKSCCKTKDIHGSLVFFFLDLQNFFILFDSHQDAICHGYFAEKRGTVHLLSCPGGVLGECKGIGWGEKDIYASWDLVKYTTSKQCN